MSELLSTIHFAGLAIVALTLVLFSLVWVSRRRRGTREFDWRPPDNFAATEDREYSFCGYENRFAYALGSLVSQPFATSKPAQGHDAEASSETKPSSEVGFR